MVKNPNRFDIVLVKLNPTLGSEIQKTRPCIVVSPDEMKALKTVIIAPMTSKGFSFVFRPTIHFENKDGLILLDRMKAVDSKTSKEIADTLQEMFRY